MRVASVLLSGHDQFRLGAARGPAAVAYDLLDHRSGVYGASVAERLGSAVTPVRAYLTGELMIEAGECLLHENALPGPQGRHLLAFLVAEHTRGVGRDEIADELWGLEPTGAWRTSLRALTSRIRAALTTAGLDGAALLIGTPGVYRVRLPANSWVDIDAALSAVHNAETLLRNGDPCAAGSETLVTRLITARPLLPGRTGAWLERQRSQLTDIRLRALDCAANANLLLGNSAQAVRDARLATEMAPLHEPSWRLLMSAHAAADDTASALAAYDRCRTVLAETLGVAPSPTTRREHAALLSITN